MKIPSIPKITTLRKYISKIHMLQMVTVEEVVSLWEKIDKKIKISDESERL